MILDEHKQLGLSYFFDEVRRQINLGIMPEDSDLEYIKRHGDEFAKVHFGSLPFILELNHEKSSDLYVLGKFLYQLFDDWNVNPEDHMHKIFDIILADLKKVSNSGNIFLQQLQFVVRKNAISRRKSNISIEIDFTWSDKLPNFTNKSFYSFEICGGKIDIVQVDEA